MTELPWIAEARKNIGLKEIVGPKHNSTIIKWLTKLKAWWRDDETPWCGVFVAHCLEEAGRPIPQHWYRASAYATYGTKLSKAAYGSIAVLTRTGGGHVAFVVGKDAKGNYLLLGGNQGNQVSISAFAPARISAFVWPDKSIGIPSMPTAERYVLASGRAAQSTSEV